LRYYEASLHLPLGHQQSQWQRHEGHCIRLMFFCALFTHKIKRTRNSDVFDVSTYVPATKLFKEFQLNLIRNLCT
jgi:hypothetical protein